MRAYHPSEERAIVSQQAGLLAQHVGRSRDPSSAEYLYVTVGEHVESIRRSPASAGRRP